MVYKTEPIVFHSIGEATAAAANGTDITHQTAPPGWVFFKDIPGYFKHGKNHKKKTRMKHATTRPNTFKEDRDFSERQQVKPDNQAQHEYFNKEESLGIEGITVTYKPKGETDYQTEFFSILSTEKEQDGSVVYANSRNFLQRMQELADQGDEVLKYKIEILEDTDGCSVQYRCANSLFLIHKLAAELDILFDCGIDAEGHGKKLIDALSGTDKTYLTAEFRSNVVFQPEAQDLTARKHSVLFCQMEDGKRKDLADLCHEILSRTERSCGVEKVEPNKRSKQQAQKSVTSIAKRTYVVRKKGVAKWRRVRMRAVGFPAGKGNGMKGHYNFRMERALNAWFAYRRIPCSCDGCYGKLQAPISSRYKGASSTCYLWKIFEKKDGSGKGLNDWGKGKFVPAKDCDVVALNALKADTLRERGKKWSDEVDVGNVVAYTVEDTTYDNFYLAVIDGQPELATQAETIVLANDTFTIYKGDWFCRGTWLEKLGGRNSRGWWNLTSRACIVRLETLIIGDVNVLEMSETNTLPTGLTRQASKKADDFGAWKLSDTDHELIVEVAQDESYLEYDEEMLEEAPDELMNGTTWASAGNNAQANDDDDNDDT